jgi:SAM-dependent methyltransferase
VIEKVDFDKYSDGYSELMRKQHAKFGDIDYYSMQKARITKIISPEDSVNILEFGCGVGRNLPFIKNEYPNSNIYGYDISQDSIDIASNNNPDVKFFSEISDDRFYKKFDLIFISGVYHHIQPELRREVTSLIYDLLNDKGRIVCFEHNPYNPLTRHMVNTCEFDEDAVLLKAKELKKIFKAQGFKFRSSSYILFVPSRFKQFSFIEKYLTWLPLGGQYFVSFEK